MTVGVLKLELAVFESHSLKDKRRVIKSMKDRIRHAFNVSIAEIDRLDSRQFAVLGVAMIGNDPAYIHGALDKIVDLVRSYPAATLTNYEKTTC